MSNKIFDDFTFKERTPEEVIQRYSGKLPEEILGIWHQYGFGSFLNGYLKFINPAQYVELLKEVYVRSEQAVPVAVTSMGDIFVWEKSRYLNLLNFRKMRVDVICAGFAFFLEDLNDISFLEEELSWEPYPEAVEIYGQPAFDECFGYVPLLGLGGTEKVENLKKVKVMEHIYLTAQFFGPLE